jgi:hypothetical protein
MHVYGEGAGTTSRPAPPPDTHTHTPHHHQHTIVRPASFKFTPRSSLLPPPPRAPALAPDSQCRSLSSSMTRAQWKCRARMGRRRSLGRVALRHRPHTSPDAGGVAPTKESISCRWGQDSGGDMIMMLRTLAITGNHARLLDSDASAIMPVMSVGARTRRSLIMTHPVPPTSATSAPCRPTPPPSAPAATTSAPGPWRCSCC